MYSDENLEKLKMEIFMLDEDEDFFSDRLPNIIEDHVQVALANSGGGAQPLFNHTSN